MPAGQLFHCPVRPLVGLHVLERCELAMSYRETNRAGQTVRKWEFHVIKSCWSFSACTAPSKSAFARVRHSLRVSQHEHHEPRAGVVKEFHFTMGSGGVCVPGHIFVSVFGVLYGPMEKCVPWGEGQTHSRNACHGSGLHHNFFCPQWFPAACKHASRLQLSRAHPKKKSTMRKPYKASWS